MNIFILIYRTLHGNPELSLQEEATAAVVASHLRSLKDLGVRMKIGEHRAGAQAMIDGGLYDDKRYAIPKPDAVLGSHIMPMKIGTLNTRKGVFGSAADSYLVTLFGSSRHGSRPHTTIDPVVLASSTVMKLQTILNRDTNPQEAVVVTVGALKAGTVENVISGKAKLLINTRTFSADFGNLAISTPRCFWKYGGIDPTEIE